MRRGKLLLTIGSTIAGLTLAGWWAACPSARHTPSPSASGFNQVTLQSPFYAQLKDGAEAAARAGGDDIVFLDANGDVNKQNNDIKDLITRGERPHHRPGEPGTP